MIHVYLQIVYPWLNKWASALFKIRFNFTLNNFYFLFLEHGINSSTNVVCFITQRYLKSSVNVEIKYASAIGKPLTICMGDRISMEDVTGGIASIIV